MDFLKNINMHGHTVTGLSNPVAESDAVTKAYFQQTLNSFSPNTIELEYSDLVNLKNNNNLNTNMFYRIIDYTATTVQSDTSSAGNQFDIVIMALSNNALSESAIAVLHDGDTYFANSKLASWDIKYSLDNDSSRFSWADSVNGKGVIYYMKDEWGNECPYDFKNILFSSKFTFNSTTNTDDTLNGASYSNKMGSYKNGASYALPNNTFGNGCYFVTLGDNCYNNTFGNGCYSISIGDNCYNNTFGNGCYSISIGDNCYNIILGNSNDNVYINSYCREIHFGNNCYYNSIQSGSRYIYCGDYNYGNTFMFNCRYINMGSSSSDTPSSYRYNYFENGVQYVNIESPDAMTNNSYVEYVYVHYGVVGTSGSPKVITVNRKLGHKTDVRTTNDVTILV